MLSKGFSKSVKSRRLGICFVFAYLMKLSMSLILHRYFPYSIFQKTRSIAIDDLRKNFFNAISK